METENQEKITQDAPLSEDELKEDELKDVAGGIDIQKVRLEQLDTQSKSVDDVQQTRLEGIDARGKS